MVLRQIGFPRQIIDTPYPDDDQISSLTVQSCSLVDLSAEKVWALFERTRPRDLYDVVEIYNRAKNIPLDAFRASLKKKCILCCPHKSDYLLYFFFCFGPGFCHF